MDLCCIPQVVLLQKGSVSSVLLHLVGSKRYSSDLEQGGLDIQAKIIFQNSNKRIIEEMKKKLITLIEEYNKKNNCYYIYVHVISFFLKKESLNSIFFSPELGAHLN